MFKSILLLVTLLVFVTLQGFAQEDSITIPQSLLDQVDKGHAESAYFIATQYNSKSADNEKFYEQAKVWMQKAAEMGYPQAMYELAQMFDYEELESNALEWYMKASEFGHSDAIYSIASIYIRGNETESGDCLKAYQWYEKAEAKENIVAYNDHAWSLATSPNKKCRNPEKALKVFSAVSSYYKNNLEPMPLAYLDTQAAVHAAISDFNRAIELQQQVVDSVDKDSENRKVFVKRLESYKNRQTWYEDN
ncbi:MAG: sel1 repeat family protein [Proteobacteria bacterium]|nr:sel1 repeat family protein [Pseudomonadota bacterium]